MPIVAPHDVHIKCPPLTIIVYQFIGPHVIFLKVLDDESAVNFNNPAPSTFQDPLPLDRCIVCCEPDWEDYFEIQEFVNKESFVFKASDYVRRTEETFLASFTFG